MFAGCAAQYYCHFTRTLVDLSPTAVQLLWLSLAAILSTAPVRVCECINVLLYNCESVYRCVPSVCVVSVHVSLSCLPSLSLSLDARGLQFMYLLAYKDCWRGDSLGHCPRQRSKERGGQCLLIVSYLRFCTDYIIYAKIDAQIECESAIDNLYKQFKARPSANITGQRQHSSTSTAAPGRDLQQQQQQPGNNRATTTTMAIASKLKA